jgi:methylase of polypeptide subunit release factors
MTHTPAPTIASDGPWKVEKYDPESNPDYGGAWSTEMIFRWRASADAYANEVNQKLLGTYNASRLAQHTQSVLGWKEAKALVAAGLRRSAGREPHPYVPHTMEQYLHMQFVPHAVVEPLEFDDDE